MKKSNNISIIDKDGEQCLECRCLQLVWRMIQAACSSMFILHFIKSTTALPVRCVIALHTKKKKKKKKPAGEKKSKTKQ